ncbi:MAG TPA: N-acetylglutaminylglutamine amidotransferase [Noviherbaspirillum sp.]|jgi:asparagine synthase (glutamine-hydrolysing)|uniref:N-acetylglutaminylglutamine amidotransferase n=1 Tax=Noviherbaspirillum sp. TaxID=1926288 RepID=UPI002DDCA12C|nr:N-acetylglutaminylglutamine amidotransferase [Noviherbaspirillum sp.]HEV2612161.1 N-acetylglutaminylglutamine amidotransferase [Noviherbaspirillum sp.]
MCGIAGELRFDQKFADIRVVADMAEAQSRRGPDGEGIFSMGSRCFGHRRLSIMDLSQRAHQPFIDNLLGMGVVFNGAIYNHHELRAELTGMGYQFVSNGDTEVIIKAWHAWGPKALDRFLGMFAFALWERDSGMTFLARDRLGIKPLYYTLNEQRMHFASSLPALLKAGDVDTSLDPQALHHYLTFHAVVPAPHTILRGVRKLPPGSLMTVHPTGKCDLTEWWRLEFKRSEEDEARSFDDWKSEVLAALRTSVKRRLVADVPVGVLLSGGLDSSLITGLLAEAGTADLRTYSIGFESVDSEAGDEYHYSDLIARHYATTHEKLHIPAAGLLQSLPDAIAAMAEPMVSHDCIAFYLLSQAVSKHSRVVQSGQGADEVFGGYHWYPPLTDVSPSSDGVDVYRRVFFDRNHEELCALLEPGWAMEDASSRFVSAHFAKPGADSAIDRAMRLDTTVMLVDDPVKRVDNMTMAFGLEARVPFLDHELVELAARIPARHKVAQGGKYVLKEAARSVIPAEVIDRPKGYFPVPALKYLRGEFLDYVRDTLDTSAARSRGLFRREEIDRMLAAPDSHITPLRGSKLWQVALLEAWLQTNGL